MRYDETQPKADTRYLANQACTPKEPTLLNTAEEALKWVNELGLNLAALERNLFGGPNKPDFDKKDVEMPFSLEGKLRAISSQAASLVGFTSTLLNKTS